MTAKSVAIVLNLVYGQYSGESDKKQDRENKGQGRDQSAKEGILFLEFKCDRTVQENDRNAEYSGEQDNPYATDRRDPLHVIEMHNERTASSFRSVIIARTKPARTKMADTTKEPLINLYFLIFSSMGLLAAEHFCRFIRINHIDIDPGGEFQPSEIGQIG